LNVQAQSKYVDLNTSSASNIRAGFLAEVAIPGCQQYSYLKKLMMSWARWPLPLNVTMMLSVPKSVWRCPQTNTATSHHRVGKMSLILEQYFSLAMP